MAQPAQDDPGQGDLLWLVRARLAATRLDLTGLTVITEAATGAYASTAVLSALAGARRVYAVTRDTHSFGSASDGADATMLLANQAGVGERISIVDALTPQMLAECDILTNAGRVRPITAPMIAQLPPEAVIALMFEAWEFRPADFSLADCRAAGIRVVGVNEQHPAVGVFPFLGPLCVRLFADAGLVLAGETVALLCDNPFLPHIEKGLRDAGAIVSVFAAASDVPAGNWSAVAVALMPEENFRVSADDVRHLAAVAPRALIVQFWGDIDRDAANHFASAIWPPQPPARSHMGILLSALGPEPVVRLQAGGLRAAELVFRGLRPSDLSVVQML